MIKKITYIIFSCVLATTILIQVSGIVNTSDAQQSSSLCDHYAFYKESVMPDGAPEEQFPEVFIFKGKCLASIGKNNEAKRAYLNGALLGNANAVIEYADTILSQDGDADKKEAIVVLSGIINSSDEFSRIAALNKLGAYFSLTKEIITPDGVSIDFMRKLGVDYLEQASEHYLGFYALYALSSLRNYKETEQERKYLIELANKAQIKHLGSIQLNCKDVLINFERFGKFDSKLVDSVCPD